MQQWHLKFQDDSFKLSIKNTKLEINRNKLMQYLKKTIYYK